ncbi:glucose-6-phosphate isomerase [Peptacetobacter hominis]|uniref:Glucose-6-phosphate isomerase n=1 Tax=Peptacetobacter hominis TaxID=2743610 RepID=A0A544QTW2_9FIRM|nr:glucose-6-phosphate isomerase [Peptacetobacter hominis]TQQ84135.1 glucose-6-phosphate isomerase [Peptacetobacter hominis]
MIKFDCTHACSMDEIVAYQDRVNEVHKWITEKTGKGNDFLGWVDWCKNYDKEEFEQIKKSAEFARNNCDVFLVCGIGGSYLGARAAIEMINGLYADKKPEIIFIGNTFSSTYISQVMKYIENKEVCVNVISKSGTTTETAIAFRLLKQFMERKYGKDGARERIFATTDKAKGTLHDLAKAEGYQMFVIPDDIGGRYSVITAVGLLPIAVAGINIDDVMNGVKKAFDDFNTEADLTKNPAYAYAVARRVMEEKGKVAEMFVSYDLNTTMLAEWWKQLFGESEGKEEKGILPCSATFSTDLHSLGQFVQDGRKCLYETLVLFEKPIEDMIFPEDAENADSMNYLAGKNLDWINKMAMQGTLEAHEKTGGVPNLIIKAEDMSAESFGYMCYFFFIACAMSCYLLDINPFNQPGVEVYKKNMFKLLGKN